MAVITLAVNATGVADDEDRNAMVYAIEQENIRRAALDPPLSALPSSTAAERRASYETIASGKITGWHQDQMALGTVASLAQIRELWPTATAAKRNAALAALQ